MTNSSGRVQNSVVQGGGRQAAARHPKVTGGKAAVSGLESGHFRRQFHRSSDSSCKIKDEVFCH